MRISKRACKLVLLIIISIVFYCFFMFFLYHNDNKYTQKELKPVNGILFLTQDNLLEDSVYFLSREWQYYPDVMLTPKDFVSETPDNYMRYITIGKYKNYSMGNFSYNPKGSASYRLIIILPDTPHTYSLMLPQIYSAYRLYINNETILELGNPDKYNYKALVGNQTVTFTASGKTEILLNVTNYSHYRSGITYAPIFGYPENVNNITNTKLFIHITIFTIMLLIGLLSLYFSIRLKKKTAWLFSLLCFCTIGYTFYPIIFTYFSLDTQPWCTIELLCTYAMLFLTLILQNTILNTEIKIHRFIYIIFAAFYFIIILYGLFPIQNQKINYFFSLLVTATQLLIAIYLLLNSVLGVIHKEEYSYLLLVCTTIFAISLISDMTLPFYEPILGGWFQEYGGMLLVFCLGFVLWKDIIEAYQLKIFFENEKHQLTRQIEIQKVHYLELTNKIEYTIRLKHDQRHHLRILSSLLQNQEINKAQKYLADYSIHNLDKERTLLCENLIIDAILQFYNKLCEQHKINFTVKLDIPVEVTVSDTDLSLIFGNLLENAYDACMEDTIHNPSIKINGKLKDDKLLIRIENTYNGFINIKANKYLSTKHNGFGIGIESVKAIIKNYDGIFDIERTNQFFIVSVIIPLYQS